MSDYIVRATAGNAQIRAFAAVTTNLVEEAREHHGTSPVATAALGRLLTGGVMMGSISVSFFIMLPIIAPPVSSLPRAAVATGLVS